MDKSRFTALNARLLARYGGEVVLSRQMEGEPPANEWDPPNPPVIVSETVKFISTASNTDLVAAGMITDNDLTGMMMPPIGPLGEPEPGDTIDDGVTVYTVMSAAPVDSDPGSVIHYAITATTA